MIRYETYYCGLRYEVGDIEDNNDFDVLIDNFYSALFNRQDNMALYYYEEKFWIESFKEEFIKKVEKIIAIEKYYFDSIWDTLYLKNADIYAPKSEDDFERLKEAIIQEKNSIVEYFEAKGDGEECLKKLDTLTNKEALFVLNNYRGDENTNENPPLYYHADLYTTNRLNGDCVKNIFLKYLSEKEELTEAENKFASR